VKGGVVVAVIESGETVVVVVDYVVAAALAREFAVGMGRGVVAHAFVVVVVAVAVVVVVVVMVVTVDAGPQYIHPRRMRPSPHPTHARSCPNADR
jgi:hypothetical protein